MAHRTRLLAALLISVCAGVSGTAVAGEQPATADDVRDLRERMEAQERVIQGQQEALARQRSQLEEQQARLAALESAPPADDANRAQLDAEIEDYLSAATQEDVALRYGSRTSLVNIHGFVNMEATSSSSRHSDFDLHHVFLFFQAALAEFAEAWVEIEYEHASETIHLNQAELRVTPFDFDLVLAGGRFYGPFGVERFTWFPPSVSVRPTPSG